MRIQFEIKESLINILDQLMHSDFWATEIKEDESGKKIIKIKDLAYNLEAVAEVMGNEIFIRTALSKYTYRIYEVKGECWCEYVVCTIFAEDGVDRKSTRLNSSHSH